MTYPSDICPAPCAGGCTKQACGFRDRFDEFTAAGYDVYGMSFDKPKSQVGSSRASWGWLGKFGTLFGGTRSAQVGKAGPAVDEKSPAMRVGPCTALTTDAGAPCLLPPCSQTGRASTTCRTTC